MYIHTYTHLRTRTQYILLPRNDLVILLDTYFNANRGILESVQFVL